MKYDGENATLTFASPEEVESFHLEVSDLLRLAMNDASGHLQDRDAGKEASRAVFKRYATVTRALNALRRVLPRNPGA